MKVQSTGQPDSPSARERVIPKEHWPVDSLKMPHLPPAPRPTRPPAFSAFTLVPPGKGIKAAVRVPNRAPLLGSITLR